jgi:hypothetical protein
MTDGNRSYGSKRRARRIFGIESRCGLSGIYGGFLSMKALCLPKNRNSAFGTRRREMRKRKNKLQ